MRHSTLLQLGLLLLLGGYALAAGSGDVELKGEMPKKLEIHVDPTPEAGALELEQAGRHSDVLVAEVKELSNSSTGYTVDITSENAEKAGEDDAFILRRGGEERIVYKVTYESVQQKMDKGKSGKAADSDEKTHADGKKKELSISYVGRVDSTGAFLTPGTYTDTLTLTISAK